MQGNCLCIPEQAFQDKAADGSKCEPYPVNQHLISAWAPQPSMAACLVLVLVMRVSISRCSDHQHDVYLAWLWWLSIWMLAALPHSVCTLHGLEATCWTRDEKALFVCSTSLASWGLQSCCQATPRRTALWRQLPQQAARSARRAPAHQTAQTPAAALTAAAAITHLLPLMTPLTPATAAVQATAHRQVWQLIPTLCTTASKPEKNLSRCIYRAVRCCRC